MKRYLSTLQSNYLYYYFIGIFLLILSLHFYYLLLFLIFFLIKFNKRFHHLTMIILLTIILVLYYSQKTIKINNSIDDNFLIVDSTTNNLNFKYTVKNKNYKFIIYSYEEFKIGEYINIIGQIKSFEKTRIPNGFDEFSYYFSNGVYGQIVNFKITKLNQRSFTYYIFNSKYYKNNSLFSKYINGSFNDETNDSLKSLNIIHLFSLSGLHIYILISLLKKMFVNYNLSNNTQNIIILTMIIILTIISNFKITLIRILIYQLLLYFKQRFKIEVDNFSLNQASFFILICFYPFLLFSKAYLMSYLIIQSIILLNPLFNEESFIIKNIYISIIINIVIIPFNNNLNLISIILSPIMTFFVTYLMLPVSLVSYLVPLLDNNLIMIFESLIIKLGQTNYSFNIGSINNNLIVLYFVLIIFILYSKKIKRIISLFCLILIVLTPLITIKLSNATLYFLDVGQGDSAVYISNDLVIVVDCYHSVGSFLKNKGINTIDYLIVSHSHDDHAKEASNLINSFNIKTVIVSKYDDNINLNHHNIIYAKNGLLIENSNTKLAFLNPIERTNNLNDSSLVFKLIYENTSVLFTGDIEFYYEQRLVSNYYYNLKSDLLKVSHHGSNTSSSDNFIKYVNPSYAVISVKSNNKFGFPHKETLETLKKYNVKVFRTDLNKTIKYKNQKVYLTQ